jgi:uncharacterized protein (DUF1684 family)
MQYRKEKDNFFKYHDGSPIPREQRDDFNGLSYYPENPDMRFEVEVIPFKDQVPVKIQTSTGDISEYIRFGRFMFEVEHEEAELTLYTSADGETFLPFIDTTSPDETYGAGRYLELEHISENTYLVDFNLAYNPWCAYSPFFSCPLPPIENRLKVPIRAGEKNYKLPFSANS